MSEDLIFILSWNALNGYIQEITVSEWVLVHYLAYTHIETKAVGHGVISKWLEIISNGGCDFSWITC